MFQWKRRNGIRLVNRITVETCVTAAAPVPRAMRILMPLHYTGSLTGLRGICGTSRKEQCEI